MEHEFLEIGDPRDEHDISPDKHVAHLIEYEGFYLSGLLQFDELSQHPRFGSEGRFPYTIEFFIQDVRRYVLRYERGEPRELRDREIGPDQASKRVRGVEEIGRNEQQSHVLGQLGCADSKTPSPHQYRLNPKGMPAKGPSSHACSLVCSEW
jgi:hypothetical protein